MADVLTSTSGKRSVIVRPELSQGTYELLAGDNYCARIPKSPSFTFVVDISRSSAEAHVAYYALSALKDFLLSRSADDFELSFSLILYDQFLHLVRLVPGGQTPSIVTLDTGSLEPGYTLQIKDFHFYSSDFAGADLAAQLDALIEDLPVTCTAPTADWASLKKMMNHVSVCVRPHGGKIAWVHGSAGMYVPKLSNKDPTKRGFFNCNDSDIHKISAELHRSMGCVDLFVFQRGSNKNVSSLGEVVRLAGGDFFLYADATETSLVNFYNDLVHSCSKSQTWETVFRLRNSAGWAKHAFGNFFTSNFSDLLKIESIDENYSLFFRFSPDKKKPASSFSNYFFVQTSLLFTDSRRRRLLRIHNSAVPLANQTPLVYLGMDYQSAVCAFVKELLIQLCSSKPLTDISIELMSRFKSQLKQMCQSTDQEFQAEQMAFMGLAFLGVAKLLIFRAHYFSDYQNAAVDRVNWLKLCLNRMSVDSLFKQLNPLLFDLSSGFLAHATSQANFEYPPTIELSWEAVAGKPLVLMDDGLQIWLLFSSLQEPLITKMFR